MQRRADYLPGLGDRLGGARLSGEGALHWDVNVTG